MDSQNPVYDPSGSYLAFASILVGLLGRVGWPVEVQTATLILAGIGALIGTIMAHYAHKNLAIAVGAIKR